jgi:preprotein translocase subunit SecA
MYSELKDNVAHLVRAQRDSCNARANEAKRSFEALGLLDEGIIEKKKFSKAEEEVKNEAFKKLWVVSKGTPRNKILKRIKENPSLRAGLDQWETYYFGDANKEEKFAQLADLYMVVDERNNEYELTDKGIQAWAASKGKEEIDDFVMLDLGYEYAEINNHPTFSEQEKMEAKTRLREEDSKRKERAHNLRQMLRAHLLMEKDVDYIVHEDKIVIIDENTGRAQPGRRFSDGLHQAIEAKENVEVQGETQTYATITLQNYFRLYDRLAGMTGTAMTEANEFKEIYKLDVLEIPTYRPCKRTDFDDEIYMTEREKYNAILKEIQAIHQQGRPILIGTESVEVSEKLSRILRGNRLEHTILNAKNNAKEAEIIADAGKIGAITLATNMAGRGTDIKLKEGVPALGGLYVIGTTRHQSRRIDRQLRGRSGRLGDPGSSKFFISFEDSLMRLFGSSPRVTALLQHPRIRPKEGEHISAKILNKSIETAQKRVEQRNYSIRKHTLEYDDVMNKQRQEVYSFRNDLLHSDDSVQIATEMLVALVNHLISSHKRDKEWDSERCRQVLITHFPVHLEEKLFNKSDEMFEKQVADRITAAFYAKLHHQKELIATFRPDLQDADTQNILQEVLRNLMVRNIDQLWQEHLLSIDHLRSDVHMRTVGQKDPLLEFKHESFNLFQSFSEKLRQEISAALFRFEMMATPKTAPKPERKPRLGQTLSLLQKKQLNEVNEEI